MHRNQDLWDVLRSNVLEALCSGADFRKDRLYTAMLAAARIMEQFPPVACFMCILESTGDYVRVWVSA